LQHKFELALDDVRRLRGRAAELEQELARRPETDDDGNIAELIHLRSERDGLVERVEELESQPDTHIDPDTQHQMSDIQRRFEMAVEDVRELKTLNAKLEAQLADSGPRSASTADSGGMDWESQKRRMLDSLSDDADADDPAAYRERATIEGTIRITDDVVAKKDDEISRLREQLAAQQHASADADNEANVNELLDADEVIQQHRKRLAQLEKETEAKLRATELELSIERAKIARKQVELNDWRAELESMQASNSKNDSGTAIGVPKRRWLSKLGLGGDDEG
jgi:chromosome segregation ATPase